MAASSRKTLRWLAVLGYVAALFVSNVFHFHDFSGKFARRSTGDLSQHSVFPRNPSSACPGWCSGVFRPEGFRGPAPAYSFCLTDCAIRAEAPAGKDLAWVVLDCPSCQFLALKSICSLKPLLPSERFSAWSFSPVDLPVSPGDFPRGYLSRAPPLVLFA
ncbi:MAG: hypothetical protein NZ899_03665 [Thermoguttaceae bacterium]|nr:hypothetical protein [Thermoguttaceae bacterium]MDW8078785.1 hypothetical protein [Thermoguttaceae bacterium]